MKIRKGFVSNSSSASFIVYKKGLSESTINKIMNPRHFAEKLNSLGYNFYADDCWTIEDEGQIIKGFTDIDNYPMNEYFEAIGLKEDIDFEYRGD